ncbi:MAG: histidine phosphatase family protein [Candidatus Uhrbacteria bacterium]
MKTIYLIRHGLVEDAAGIFYPNTYPLSERGVTDVKTLAAQILEANLKPFRMVSSPHMRTRETAEIIAQAINGNVETDERLVEWQVGSWIGKPLVEFRKAAGYLDPPPFHLKLDDVESFEAMSERIIRVITDELTKLPEGGLTMIISHREPIVSAILKLQHEETWENIPNLDVPKPCAWKLTFEGDLLIQAIKAFDTSQGN